MKKKKAGVGAPQQFIDIFYGDTGTVSRWIYGDNVLLYPFLWRRTTKSFLLLSLGGGLILILIKCCC